LEWIKKGWIIAVIVVLIIAAVTLIVFLCRPRRGTYTNAWYVMRTQEKGRSMRGYVKIPQFNAGHLPNVEESEELNKTVSEKQKKI